MQIVISAEPIDVAGEHAALVAMANAGAVVLFTGHVREEGAQGKLLAMELEHYPGMTESAIADILQQAAARWELLGVRVCHRIGRLHPGECIVSVAVAARHRRDAFSAAEFVMDYLKTRAPFWKKEITADGEYWVEQKAKDGEAAARW